MAAARISKRTGLPVRAYNRNAKPAKAAPKGRKPGRPAKAAAAETPQQRHRRGQREARKAAGAAKKQPGRRASSPAKPTSPGGGYVVRNGAAIRAGLEAAGLMLPGVVGLILADPAEVAKAKSDIATAERIAREQQAAAEEQARKDAADKGAAKIAAKAERAAQKAAEAAKTEPPPAERMLPNDYDVTKSESPPPVIRDDWATKLVRNEAPASFAGAPRVVPAQEHEEGAPYRIHLRIDVDRGFLRVCVGPQGDGVVRPLRCGPVRIAVEETTDRALHRGHGRLDVEVGRVQIDDHRPRLSHLVSVGEQSDGGRGGRPRQAQDLGDDPRLPLRRGDAALAGPAGVARGPVNEGQRGARCEVPRQDGDAGLRALVAVGRQVSGRPALGRLALAPGAQVDLEGADRTAPVAPTLAGVHREQEPRLMQRNARGPRGQGALAPALGAAEGHGAVGQLRDGLCEGFRGVLVPRATVGHRLG